MILEKQSSLLGYSNETVKPLNANHHDVCKFTGPDDPNYRSVRDALRSIVGTFQASIANDGGAKKELDILRTWLDVTGAQDDDISQLRSMRKAGTCEEFLKAPEFENWLTSNHPHILWAHAPPGNGKSVQCSSVIDFLQSQYKCAYWFFRYGDVDKQSLANLFRSVAYQIASKDATFRHSLVEQAKSGMQVIKADAPTAWRIIFAPRLSILSDEFFWVMDALDESESSRTLIDLVSNIGQSESRIRVLFFSRPLSNIKQSFHKARKRVPVTEIILRDNLKDIRLAATDEMEDFPADDDFKRFIVDEITSRSQGSFLWASLVLKRVHQCLRPGDVRRVLRDAPDGMNKLYNRMAQTIAKIDRDADRRLCKLLLSWATYSVRPLTVDELKVQYARELETFLDLNHLISQICGEFAMINQSNQLVLVHQTAREYLRTTDKLGFTLESTEVNKELLATCLKSLNGLSPNKRLQRKTSQFVSYSSVFWSSHLDRCSVDSDDALEMLFKFFNSDLPPSWIHAVALSGQLSTLLKVSSSLNAFVRRRRKAGITKPPRLQRLPELAFLEAWAVDLLKITAKFGSYLSQNPDTIYTCVPALSPENSIIHQKFSNRPAATISVAGLSNMHWDDCLARVSTDTDQALHVAVSSQLLSVASESNGKATIRFWSSSILQERAGFSLDEPICTISFSNNGSLFACYGLDHTFVWNIADGSDVVKVKSPHRERAMALQFAPDESFIVVATNLRRIYQLDLKTENPSWTTFDSTLLEERVTPEGAFVNSPSSLAFNEDCTQLAVAYRGFPLAIWSLDPPKVLARNKKKQKQGRTIRNTWTGVDRVVWHPFNGQVLGIYRDGNIFKWRPSDNAHAEVKEELDSTPTEIQCSRNGTVFSTSDVRGFIKIYDYSHMVLIYKLTSDDIINAIAFSPDSRRLYDLRGSYCNVWEPNCLLRTGEVGVSEDTESIYSSESERRGSLLSELDEDEDEDEARNASLIAYESEAQVENRLAITVVATCLHNQQICAYAKEEGIVEIYDMGRNIKHVITQSAFGMAVSHVVLSKSGDCIAYSMQNGRVHVKSLDLLPEHGKVKVGTIYSEKDPSNRGTISQLLFDAAAEHLFIRGREKLQIIRVADSSMVAEVDVEPTEQTAIWENQLTDPDILLAFTADHVRAYSWRDLELKYTIPMDIGNGTNGSTPASPLTMEFLLTSYYPGIHLAVTSYEESHSKYFTFLLLNTSALASSPSPERTIRSLEIPSVVTDQIDRPLGILEDGRLIFLDKNLWVCTARLLYSPECGLKRHFFLPPDWLTSASLLLCRVQADGTLLCPSRGEMAVVKSEIGMDW
jgi:WD40 repeat protein